ncbi:hypothetical protein AB0B15_14340 [Streptomyces sp. NPDC045456]|uniref:hypothetical protein n=1 Tax=Streptomyces sp. NPDC045456 TaxID=3155254 RepID=UPI0033E39D1D
MFYDPEGEPTQLVIRYAVGQQEREAVVLTNGHTLEEHVQRLEALMEQAAIAETTIVDTFVTWPLVAGGAVAIRLDSIIALEDPGSGAEA